MLKLEQVLQAADHVTRRRGSRGRRWMEMTDVESHLHYLKTVATPLQHCQWDVLSPWGRGECCRINERMAAQFRASLPTGFHATVSSSIKIMKHIKKGVKMGDKNIFNLETIFFRLLTVGQQQQMKLGPIFQYELCPIPPSLIDEYSCLRKGSKASLAHKLCIQTRRPLPPDVTIIDASQLLYHIMYRRKEMHRS